MRSRCDGGFSLIEVLIATAILAVGLLAVFSSLSPALSIFAASQRLQEMQWVLALGELKHPVAGFEELEDLVVEEDDDLSFDGEELGSGCVFSRTIDEKEIEEEEDDDGIYVLRTKVVWDGKEDTAEELVRLIWKKGAGGYTP